MPRWGQFKWGEKKWGMFPLDATELAEIRVLSGPYGPFDAIAPGKRRDCTWKIWHVTDALAPVHVNELPVIAGTASISRNLSGPLESGTLTFSIPDPNNNYRSGELADEIAVGNLVRVEGMITTDQDTLSRNFGVFRISAPPTDGRDENGVAFLTVTAEDRYRHLFNRSSGYQIRSAILAAEDVIATDPIPDKEDSYYRTYGGTVHALLWYLTAHNVHSDAVYGGGIHYTSDDITEVPLGEAGTAEIPTLDLVAFPQIGQPVKCTFMDFLDWVHGTLEPLAIVYDANGMLHLWSRIYGPYRGLLITAGTEAGLPRMVVPAESYVRNLSKPNFTKVTAYVDNTSLAAEAAAVQEALNQQGSGGPVGDAGGTGGIGIPLYEAYAAESMHPKFPSDLALYETEVSIIDAIQQRDGFGPLAPTLAARMLADELASADQLTVQVDSAFPENMLGQIVQITDLPIASGFYRLVSVTQPLAAEPQSWSLEWVSGNG